MPEQSFDWVAEAYLDLRSGETDGRQYIYADGLDALGAEKEVSDSEQSACRRL